MTVQFSLEEQLVLRLSPNVSVFDWAGLGGSRIHTCGHSFSCGLSHLGASDLCTCVHVDTASLTALAVPRNLVIVSKNIAAAI